MTLQLLCVNRVLSTAFPVSVAPIASVWPAKKTLSYLKTNVAPIVLLRLTTIPPLDYVWSVNTLALIALEKTPISAASALLAFS
jgi:hypothetical protein